MYSYVTASRARSGTSVLFKEGNIFWFISAGRDGEGNNRTEFLKGNKTLHGLMPDREPLVKCDDLIVITFITAVELIRKIYPSDSLFS